MLVAVSVSGLSGLDTAVNAAYLTILFSRRAHVMISKVHKYC